MRSLGLLLVLCLFSCMFTNAERCEANGIGITKSRFDAPVKQYYYASADQQDIYVLTYAGTIYRSTDRGLTFLNKMSSFPQWNNGSMAYPHGRTGVKKIHGTGTDHIVYFEGNYLSYWVTRGDDIYKLYNLGSTDASGAITGSVVQKLSVNPQQPSTLFRIIVSPICFSSNFEECNQMLQVSMYEGADNSWVDVNDYTFKAAWGAQEDQLLYITIEEQYRIPDQTEVTQLDQHKELNVAMDYGQTLLEAVPHVIDFVYKNGVVYFVKYTGDTLIPYSTNDASSANEMTFAGATNLNFTTGMPAFNILTSGEDVSFISVAQGQPFSNLYQSPANDASYWISLEYLRTDGAGVDFYKTNDLPGVYIANRYAADKAFSDERNDYIETVISFDQGGQWVRLDSIDHMDEFVNLFITAEYTGQPIQSSEQAAGILYSLGNEGEYRLDDDMGLYLSRTGGKKWERVLDGNHIFAFNDHASLITATEQRGDTSTLLYSWNQGISWETCSWGDSEPFTVQAIIPLTNYPNGLQFLIFGELHNGEGIGMSVDFMQNIPRICAEPDDYETFEAVVGDTCLLGRSTPYIRRKRDSACVAPGIEQQQGNSFNCACTRYDFQCDGDCFEERHVEGELNTVCVNICEGQENDPTLPPADCQGRYYQTQGYRKVPGDTCIGGTEYLPVLTDCPSEISPSSSNSASPIPSPSSSPLPSASSSPAPSSSSTGTATVTKSPEPSPSASSQPEPSPSASSQPEPSPSASSQPEPSPSASSQPEPSPSSEPEPSPSSQPEPSPSSEPEPSASGSPQPEPSSVGKTESPTPTSSLAKTVMVSKTVAGSPGDSSNVSSEESSNEEETEGLPIPIIVGSSVAIGFVGVVAIACIAAVVIFIKKKKTGKSKAARMEEEDVFSLEDNDEWEL